MCETWTDDGCMDAGTDWCRQKRIEFKWDKGLRKRPAEVCGADGCGCHVDYGGDRDAHGNRVEPTLKVVICNDRHESSNSNINQKFYYVLNRRCDSHENCDAKFVAKRTMMKLQ